MDNFKLFNDTYGHPVGDHVLRRVAETLRDVCRPQDIIGRYGGDEFIVVLPGAHTAVALSIAQNLRIAMAASKFAREEEVSVVPISLCYGVASFPEDSTNRHELLTIADANLYAAKHSDESIVATTRRQRENRQLRDEQSFAMLDALISTIDNKDRYTRRHSENVTEYALMIAEAMGLSGETLKEIRVSALLHDVGKIGVPDEILRKPGSLDLLEFETMQSHSSTGALILSAIPGMGDIAEAVRSHHERWDGNGYPDQKPNETIPLIGRILAVADAFSAMTSDRVYRRRLGKDDAVQELRANKGTQFDPDVVDTFIRLIQAKHRQQELGYADAEQLPVELVP